MESASVVTHFFTTVINSYAESKGYQKTAFPVLNITKYPQSAASRKIVRAAKARSQDSDTLINSGHQETGANNQRETCCEATSNLFPPLLILIGAYREIVYIFLTLRRESGKYVDLQWSPTGKPVAPLGFADSIREQRD